MFAFNVAFNRRIKTFKVCKTCHLKSKAKKQGSKEQEAGGFPQEQFAFFSTFQQFSETEEQMLEDSVQLGGFLQKSFSEAVKGGRELKDKVE